MDEPRCPACGSKNVINSSAAYEQGQSTYSGRSRGIGASSSGQLGVFSGSHAGERMTSVAEKNAPPSIDASNIACFAFALLPALIFGGMLLNDLEA